MSRLAKTVAGCCMIVVVGVMEGLLMVLHFRSYVWVASVGAVVESMHHTDRSSASGAEIDMPCLCDAEAVT